MSQEEEMLAELSDIAETLRHLLIVLWKIGSVPQHSNLSARLMTCADIIEWVVSDLSEKAFKKDPDVPF